tara:strand:- start:203 stop:724 length:522 start_codon:yes stop_codon:yes gene_type:complete
MASEIRGSDNFDTGNAGKVLQVVSTVKTDASSFTSASTNTFVDLAGLTVTITPSSTTSKILVMYTVHVAAAATNHVRLMRGATALGVGDLVGSRLQSSTGLRTAGTPYTLECANLTGTFLDSPATTSATTYKLQGTLGASYNTTFYINRSQLDSNTNYGLRLASTITVMEISV